MILLTVDDAESEATRLLAPQFSDPDPYVPPLPREPLAAHRIIDYTLGDWSTETASAAAFDRALGSRYWTIYREVPGVLIQPRPHQIDKTVRIDRILTPKPELIRAGWNHGTIGVEIKRSEEKIGPPIAQALDYGRSVFTLPGGSRVWLDWVFIWPAPKQSGAMASVLAQNRLGTATPGYRGNGIHFKSGENKIVYVDEVGDVTIQPATNGTKVGRR